MYLGIMPSPSSSNCLIMLSRWTPITLRLLHSQCENDEDILCVGVTTRFGIVAEDGRGGPAVLPVGCSNSTLSFTGWEHLFKLLL